MKTECAHWSPLGSESRVRAMLSLRETVVLASVEEDDVRKDIEVNVLSPIRYGNKPCFRWVDVFLVGAVYRNHLMSRTLRKVALEKLEVCVAPSFRRTCTADYDELVSIDAHLWVMPSNLETGWNVSIDHDLYINLDRVRDDLNPRVDLYARGLKRVEEKPDIFGGEAVFRNTRLPVRHIGQMANRGEPVENIIEDYPYLDEDDVAFAKLYSEAHPNVGRPRSLKGANLVKTSAR